MVAPMLGGAPLHLVQPDLDPLLRLVLRLCHARSAAILAFPPQPEPARILAACGPDGPAAPLWHDEESWRSLRDMGAGGRWLRIASTPVIAMPVDLDRPAHPVRLLVADAAPETIDLLLDLTRQAALLLEAAARAEQLAHRVSSAQMLIDIIPITVAIVDRDGVYRFANKAYEKWLKRPLHAIIGQQMNDLFAADTLRQRQLHAEQALAGIPTRLEVEIGEFDGVSRIAELRYVPHHEPNGAVNGFYVVGFDITDRKRAEQALLQKQGSLEQRVADRSRALAAANDQLQREKLQHERTEAQLRQAQKMEAVGQLTGGLAHDFNNLLGSMVGALELLRTRVTQGRTEELGRYLDIAQNATDRAAALTHRLLAFARRQTLNSVPTDVNVLIGGMLDLVSRTVGPTIQVDIQLENQLWTTLCDPHQLENALLNLSINARDAMPGGGALVFSSGNTPVDAEEAERLDLLAGDYVAIRVRDTGLGMTPEVIARAFDPFFTTKPLGQGTGLGLSMIYGFARQSGGHVCIQSEPGQGTTVTLLLPRHEGEITTEAQPGQLTAAPRAVAGETVLVVDDEAAIRGLVVETLTELDYRTIEAVNAEAALRMVESETRIDLMVSDVGLPGGMDGRQLADAAIALRPALRVLFITGYAEAAMTNTLLRPGMQVMSKPFALEALATRVRDLLGA